MPKFHQLSITDQREEIKAYMEKLPHQRGLISEAISEHRYKEYIYASFYAGDYTRFGDLSDSAIREYVGNIIDNDKNWRIEE